MFIRIKTINKAPYAYLVANTWRKRDKSTKQAVKKYLGRVLEFGKNKVPNYTIKGNTNAMIKQIVINTLKTHAFEQERGRLIKKDILIDLTKKTVQKGKKKVVLKIQEGYLCTHTFRQVFKFKIRPNRDLVEEGARLAESIVQAGLTIPKDQFVTLFEQFWKQQFTT